MIIKFPNSISRNSLSVIFSFLSVRPSSEYIFSPFIDGKEEFLFLLHEHFLVVIESTLLPTMHSERPLSCSPYVRVFSISHHPNVQKKENKIVFKRITFGDDSSRQYKESGIDGRDDPQTP